MLEQSLEVDQVSQGIGGVVVRAVWRPGWLTVGASATSHFLLDLSCATCGVVARRMDRSCSIVKRCASCHGWKKDGMSSNKESPQRRMRMIFCERSVAVTKTSGILTMSNLCGLCYCRPAFRWRGCVIGTLRSVPFTRLVSCIQHWLAPDEQAWSECFVHLNGTSRRLCNYV